MAKSPKEHAESAREFAATYLEEALRAEKAGNPIRAQQAFEDAVNAERWAVYYEAKATEKKR